MIDTSQSYNFYYQNTSFSVGDAVSASFFMASGSYTFYVLPVVSSQGSTVTVYIDGVSQGTFSTYNAGTFHNSTQTLSVTVATSGTHTLKLAVSGSGAGAGNYMWYTKVWIK